MEVWAVKFKRYIIYLACMIPFICVLSLLLTRAGLSLALNIFICVLSSLAVIVVVELFFSFFKAKRVDKDKLKPKKKDPYAD